MGVEGGSQFVMLDIKSRDPLFNLLFSNYFSTYVYLIRRLGNEWRFFNRTSLENFYIPISEELNVEVNPSANVVEIVQSIRLKTLRENVPSIIFLLSDEMKVSTCNINGSNYDFEQFSYLRAFNNTDFRL